VSYNDEYLYCLTESEIHICKVALSNFENGGKTIDSKDLTVRVVKPNRKIHLVTLNEFCIKEKYVLIALETDDNQLDYNRLYLDNFDNDQTFKPRYFQQREWVPRGSDYEADPIVKINYTFNPFNHTMALRRSGSFDIYWNFMRVDTVEDRKYY
jgi:hypothetical protein